MITNVIKTIQQAIAQGFMHSDKTNKQIKTKEKNQEHKQNNHLTANQSANNLKRNDRDANLLLFLSTVLVMLSFSCQASNLEIINDDSAKVEVLIEAGDRN